MSSEALKMRTWITVSLLALVSFCDVALVLLTVPGANGKPVLPLDLSEGSALDVIYGVAIAVFLASALLSRRVLQAGPRLPRAVAVLFGVFLVGRGALTTLGPRPPFDRARAAKTAARLRLVDERLQQVSRTSGSVPRTLDELGLAPDELIDEWRVKFQYVPLAGGRGYRLWSSGVPPGKPALQDYYPRLVIERRAAPAEPPHAERIPGAG